jgi:hypothetical protein
MIPRCPIVTQLLPDTDIRFSMLAKKYEDDPAIFERVFL